MYDGSIIQNKEYQDYFSLYERFPTPPGLEYLAPRNCSFDSFGITSPWQYTDSSFPVPDNLNPISFSDAADSFGEHISQQIDQGKTIYLLWSGGIDSTCIAVSLLRNLKREQYSQVVLVSSQASRIENPWLYHKFLKDFGQLEFKDFKPSQLDITKSLILDGEGGDQIFGGGPTNKTFSKYPEKILLPWRDNIDFLHSMWNVESNPRFWDLFYNMMTTSIDAGAPVETLYEFYWWLNFNFKLDGSMYRSALYMAIGVEDFEYFFKNTICRFYTWPQIQQWSMTARPADKIGTAGKTIKSAGKQYIYDFDHNEYYYREKRKEFSLRLTLDALALDIAVDEQYNRYNIGSRSFRQELKNMFHPNQTGLINFYPSTTFEDFTFAMTANVK
jgi:hypothetical protein